MINHFQLEPLSVSAPLGIPAAPLELTFTQPYSKLFWIAAVARLASATGDRDLADLSGRAREDRLASHATLGTCHAADGACFVAAICTNGHSQLFQSSAITSTRTNSYFWPPPW